ncbi:hypothetical protein Vi05172_g5503 [Venturia inaequalis]|nr:hypothetical protein Vi05172_g5503 [Venturia inaequalis]
MPATVVHHIAASEWLYYCGLSRVTGIRTLIDYLVP